MKVPLLDLKLQYAAIKEEIRNVTDEIFESQYFILGPNVEKLEKEVAEYCNTQYSVGVSSGSDALIICLMVAGVGADDLVLTTPYTFFATAGAINRVGARPVFADIEPETYNISPDAIEQTIGQLSDDEKSRLKCIVPVHLYGQCAEMDRVSQVAEQFELVIIEDAAQAIGSEYKGRRAGSIGDFGCFSFFPSKNLGAFGDGGIVTTSSDHLFEQLKVFRNHGSKPKYYHKYVGGNFRLDALQAAIVSVKLKYLDDWSRARQENAENYRRLFADAGLDQVGLPVAIQDRHIYNQFVIRVAEKRDALRQHLQQSGIGTEVYYPLPLHMQECFNYLGYSKGDFPESESAADQTLALPIYPELTNDQQEYVVLSIKAFFS